MLKKDVPSRWIYDYFSPFEVHKHAIKGTIYHGYSEIQEIVIAESHSFGRCLILDNEFQSFEVDEFVYHEALVQPALILHPEPTKIAIIGGGEGAALREVLRHKTVKKAVMVDIDDKVIECSRKYLPSFHNGSFSDERTKLVFKDGRKFIEETDETFDVIIIDITCPLEGGPSFKLFTQEFYEHVRQKLTAQGLFSIQASTTSPISLHTYTVVNRTLKEVFPGVFPYAAYVPSFAMYWGFCLATKGLDPNQITKEDIDKRISERIKGELRFYDGTTHQALFNLPKYVRKAIKEQKHINRDSEPLMEKYPGLVKKE
ncbi:MAG: spermidine synthase (putrescine aminopropyltransferase) [Candidatus Scalindua rubra]|uniref:Polyamine aminopropyltransferase n=1 Tax=Candidatus Scalindua rubra TaxID=1872076 RepID=A0A1E3XCC6_9BACT|nr:MAG: spermidine synthase (putrescine aminopropyltransferase) [Candidatus Scalindua rubra]